MFGWFKRFRRPMVEGEYFTAGGGGAGGKASVGGIGIAVDGAPGRTYPVTVSGVTRTGHRSATIHFHKGDETFDLDVIPVWGTDLDGLQRFVSGAK